MATPLHEIRACVFDAYGTLFDVASAAHRCRDALDGQAAALAARWRDKQLQYTWLRTIQGRHVDFLQVTRDALAYAMEELGIAGPALQEQLVEAYCTLDAYAEVPDVLRRIRAAGYATAILSNGSPAMLGRMVAHAGIADLFDAVLSVEAVGVFKPDAKVYQSAVDHFGLRAAQIYFLSSNAWDAYAASAFGMRVVWCNRYGLRDERLPGAPDARIRTLEELAPLLGRAVRG